MIVERKTNQPMKMYFPQWKCTMTQCPLALSCQYKGNGTKGSIFTHKSKRAYLYTIWLCYSNYYNIKLNVKVQVKRREEKRETLEGQWSHADLGWKVGIFGWFIRPKSRSQMLDSSSLCLPLADAWRAIAMWMGDKQWIWSGQTFYKVSQVRLWMIVTV